MLSFPDRLKIGDKREIDFQNYLDSNGIRNVRNIVHPYDKVEIEYNATYGDFLILYNDENIFVDVKNTYKIYESSINKFVDYGYYLLAPDNSIKNIENGWLIHGFSIKKYYAQIPIENRSYDEDKNGNKYYYFQVKPTKWSAKKKVSEFFNTLVTPLATNQLKE